MPKPRAVEHCNIFPGHLLFLCSLLRSAPRDNAETNSSSLPWTFIISLFPAPLCSAPWDNAETNSSADIKAVLELL
jgi:hypothetical protein